MKHCIQIDPEDNVYVALQDLPAGMTLPLDGKTIGLQENIPAKHKFFSRSLEAGDGIFMYGVLVGRTRFPVAAGARMTTENTVHATEPYSWKGTHFSWKAPDISRFRNRFFNGYLRSDGRVGTANHWLFIPAVFCENRNLDVIREALHNELGYAVTEKYKLKTRQLVNEYLAGKDLSDFPLEITEAETQVRRVFQHVDGIKFLNHQGGCGGTRQDAALLSALLAAYADHPNVGGITFMSLGCQNVQAKHFLDDLKKRNPDFDKPLLIFEQQRSQSEEHLILSAIRETIRGLDRINRLERKPFPLSKLTVGVKCGGSDGFSGISANPAVGYAADLLVALGGKVLLAEFPELHGAEQDLINRCAGEAVANKFIRLMKSYSDLAERVGSGFHANPSAGNIRDGLITDAMKSAGAAKKGGTSPVTDVLDYTEPAVKEGLNLVCTPGNDVEATTGKVASGATLILFTTGLGTPTGNPVSPTIKIATNTALAKRMGDIIDINAGSIISGEKTIPQMGEEILEYSIRVASGEATPQAVRLNQDDFIPWKQGVSL
jgi:altronate hydrolase